MEVRISKREWYNRGGFANSRLFRRGTRRGWTYWMEVQWN